MKSHQYYKAISPIGVFFFGDTSWPPPEVKVRQFVNKFPKGEVEVYSQNRRDYLFRKQDGTTDRWIRCRYLEERS